MININDIKFDKIIGIDVGLSGGLAVYDGKKTTPLKMPVKETKHPRTFKKIRETDIGVLTYFLQQHSGNHNVIVFIESVSLWSSDQAGTQFRIQMMLANYHSVLALLETLKIPYVKVTAQEWQRYLNLNPKGVEKSKRKRIYKEFAQSQHPPLKITLATADAVCILHYARLKIANDPMYIFRALKNNMI